MADEPASPFFKEPGKGLAAAILPNIFYHKLYDHSYSEIAQYLDNIDSSSVSDNRKKYEKETTFDVVKTSREYNAKAIMVVMLVITLIVIIAALNGMYNFTVFGFIVMIFTITVVNYMFFADTEAKLYLDNFKAAHGASHGKPSEMQDLIAQELLDYPKPLPSVYRRPYGPHYSYGPYSYHTY